MVSAEAIDDDAMVARAARMADRWRKEGILLAISVGLEITGETQTLVWAFECLEFMSLSSRIVFIQVIQNRMRWGFSLTRRETLPRSLTP